MHKTFPVDRDIVSYLLFALLLWLLVFTVAVGVFRRGGSQELAPATERDRGGVP